jgi:hypothetical protein
MPLVHDVRQEDQMFHGDNIDEADNVRVNLGAANVFQQDKIWTP